MAFYKKRIERRDTQADINWRLANNRAIQIAVAETKQKYPVVSADNFAEACAYQDRRIAELTQIGLAQFNSVE
jgi:vancomycin resistance protein YoaR